MKLSVIVPVYNIEKFLCDCLDSLLDQGLNESDYEIICINDGSKDGSLQILNDYAEKNKNIVVINKENAGVSAARNDGLRVAKGKYIAFCDSDDCYRSYSLAGIVNFMEENSVQTVVCAEYVKVSENFVYSHEESFGLNFKILQHSGFYTDTVWSMVIEKSLIEKGNIRFVNDMKNGEDTLFATRIYAACMENNRRVAVLNTPVYCYRDRVGSAVYQQNLEGRLKDTYTLTEEYHKIEEGTLNKILKKNLGMRVDSLVSTLLFLNLRIKKYPAKEFIQKLTDDGLFPRKRPLWTLKDCPMKTKLLNIFKCALMFKPIYHLCFAITKK